MEKLIFHIDDDWIAATKNEAASRNTSVSRSVSSCFRVLSESHGEGIIDDPPLITTSLLGCVEGAEVTEKEYFDHLKKKHS